MNADLDNLNPENVLQGHNGEKQIFTRRRSIIIQDKKNNRQIKEFVLDDQFGNLYVVYRASLHDNEVYDVADWLMPSMLAKYGGFTDHLIDDLRTKAFAVFEKTAREIDQSRSIASSVGYVGDGASLVI